MATTDIVLAITEPESEWVCGRALQKMSPTRSHSLLQAALSAALSEWAGERGEVGPEWRFRVSPPGEPARPLVPDVAYVAVERLKGLTGDDLEVPRMTPDVVVEILSPGDRRVDVDDKVATYLAAGAALVIVVDPKTRAVELHDPSAVVVLAEGESVAHAALPGFELSVAKLFAVIAPPI
jgi:Uma2 family endonuclease